MKLKSNPFVRLSTLITAATIAFAASAQAAIDVAGGNGNFDATNVSDMSYFGPPDRIYNGGFTTLEGWTFSGPGSVFLWLFEPGNPYGPVIGNYSLNLTAGNGGQANAVSTTVTGLTAGLSYTLSFDTAARSGAAGTVTVKVDGASLGTFNNSVGASYVSRGYSFIAAGPTATLAFEYPGVTNNGFMLDNVAVAETPPTDGIWTGGDGNWSTAGNWNANTIAQGIDKSATFNGLTPITATVDISRPIGALIFSGANHTIAAGSGSLTLDGDTLFAPPKVNVATGITATISTLLGGTEGMAKIGDGTLRLTAPPAYTGGTTVTAGTLKLELGARAGTENFSGSFSVASGATLNLDNTNATVGGYYPGNFVLSGAGTLSKTNTGSIDLWNGSNLTGFTGTVDVQQGALRLNNIVAGGNMPQATLNIASGATFDVRYNASLSVDKLTGTGTLDQSYNNGSGLSVTIGSNDGSSTFDGVIQNSSGQPLSLTKVGTGTLTLTGANTYTYTGTTTVSGGILSLSSATLNDNAPVVIGTSGKMNLTFAGSDAVGSLDIDGSGPLPPGTYNSSHPTYGSFFTGTGSLVIPSVNGTWTSLVNGNWSTDTNWSGNSVADGVDATATFNAVTGVTVTLDTNRKIGNLAFAVSDYTIAGANTLTLDTDSATPAIGVTVGRSATISANLAGNDGMEKTGTGTLVFTGVKTYIGGTTVTGGTLELSGGNSGNSIIRGALTISPGATVALTGGDGSGFGWNNPVTSINVDGGTINAAGGCHLGFGANTTMTLTNGSSVQGNWNWNGDGLLYFSSYGNATNTISGALTLRADAGANHTFFVDDGTSATDLQINANLSDQWPEYQAVSASGLTKTGVGTMVLNGINTYDGNTVVNDGALNVTAASSLRFRPTTNGANNSVSGSGTATLSFLGTVSLDLTVANTTVGNSWNLFNLASFTTAPVLNPAAVTSTTLGSFTQVTPGVWELPVTGAKWVFTKATGSLTYVNAATPYETWGSAYGLGAGSEGGDLDNDGLTNFQEFAFGLIPNSGSSVNPITVQLVKSTGQFTYQRLNGSGLTYTVWTSPDLVNWSEDTTATAGQAVTGTVGDVQTVVVTLTGAPLSATKLFVRVKAQ